MATTSDATIHQRCSPSVARSQAGLLSAVPKARVRAPVGSSAMMRIVLARPPGTGRTRVHHHLSWLEAGVVGAMQGVAELFPVSSLGHSVLLPAVVGGSWARDLNVRTPESPYLAFIVGLHVATAIALLVYFWRDWVRTTLSRPVPTAIFLAVNGVVLLGAEQLRRREGNLDTEYVDERVSGPQSDERLAKLPTGQAVLVGSAQILALAPGISRSGITMVGGLLRGLSREDAARFSFLLATPVILAAGALKLGDLNGPLGDGIRGQVLFGSLLSGIGAYLSVRFLTRYFANRSLRPFGVYCLIAGAASLLVFAVR